MSRQDIRDDGQSASTARRVQLAARRGQLTEGPILRAVSVR